MTLKTTKIVEDIKKVLKTIKYFREKKNVSKLESSEYLCLSEIKFYFNLLT